nr:DUF2953 domain-containing protein [Sporolactobacillus sp. STSJ-5]
MFIILSGLFASILLLICFIAVRSTLTIRVKFLIGAHHFHWSAEVYLWGRQVWTIKSRKRSEAKKKTTGGKAGGNDSDNDQEDSLKLWNERLDNGLKLLRSLNLGECVVVRHMVWVTTCGTGDAVETALLSGIIWSIKASILPWVSRFCSDRPRINVVPTFQRKTLNSDLSCMFQVKIGDAIAMIKKIRRHWKEG